MRAQQGYYVGKSGLAILISTAIMLFIAEGFVATPDCTSETVLTESTTTPTTTKETSEGPTDSSGPWTNIRLPDSLVPIEYDIDLRPILEPNEEGMYIFRGSSSVSYKCKTATNYIIMHSIGLDYTKDQLSLKEEDTEFPIQEMMFYEPNEFVVIKTQVPCNEGKTYHLTVKDFVAQLSDDLIGLYRSEYDTPEGEHRVIATSHMHPNGARDTFPCFDEPALKANFTITLWHRANNDEIALSNMPAESYGVNTIEGELWNYTTFQKTVPMSTYLLALMVADFSYEQTFSSDGKIQTRVYARTEAVSNGEAVYSSQIAPQILDFYESYFDVPYALPKSDQAAVPDFDVGAMENWGLVLYRETILLYNDKVSSIFDKRICTNIVAHELAHQWFGNLVSHAWWDNVWLSEGFATYVSYLGEAAVQPTWKSNEQFLPNERDLALEVDALTSSHPLVQPVSTPSEILSQYDDISYSKGACVLTMINGFMGEQSFVAGLTAYLNDHAYGVATHNDLFKHLEEQANKDGLKFPTSLTRILETWTLQMGYPVVNIRKQIGTNVYRVSQQYFLLDTNAILMHTPGSLTYGYQWYIPLTYKTFNQMGTEETSQMWLELDKDPVSITETEYLLANIDVVGYYRVNYDDATWGMLSAKLKSDSFTEIPTKNRAQLIDDAFNLARPGLLDITVGMTISQYLIQENEYVPWKTFMDRVKFIEYIVGRSGVFGPFSNYAVKLVESSIYAKYGWEENDKSDSALVERMTLQLGIQGSCYYGSHDCIYHASSLYKEWMANPENISIISSTYRDDVYCAAIRNGGIEEWNFAWERHNAISNVQEKESLRYGMACSKETWILTRYMQYCVDTNFVRRQDSLRTCLQYIGGEEYGRDLAWAFMLDNWNVLVEQYGGGIYFGSLIEVITRRFSTEYDLQKLEDFKSSTTNLGSAVRAVDQAIDRTKVNIRWRELNENKLAAWLGML